MKIISKDLAILLKAMNSAATSMIKLVNIWHFFLQQSQYNIKKDD